jgi:hypothetical protein
LITRTDLEPPGDRRILHAVEESRRLTLVRHAIEVVLRRLSLVPPSPAVDELRLKAGDCLQQAQGWQCGKPTTEQWEALMKRVLALHIELAKLERQRPGP